MTHSRAVSLMILVTLMWSSAGVITRHLEAAHRFEITFWRSSSTAIALMVTLTALRGPSLWRQIPHWPAALWVSGLCWGAMFTAFMVALTLTGVANVLITMAVGPLITALFARIFLKQQLSPTTWLAIALAGIGIAWMFAQASDTRSNLAGTLVAFIVPLSAAINWTVLQHSNSGLREGHTDMLPAVWVGAMLSAVSALPFAWPLNASLHDIGLLSFLGVFQLTIPCLLVVRLSRELPAAEIALLGLLEVVAGVVWAWLWAGETPSFNTLTGGTLVLSALIGNELLAMRQR